MPHICTCKLVFFFFKSVFACCKINSIPIKVFSSTQMYNLIHQQTFRISAAIIVACISKDTFLWSIMLSQKHAKETLNPAMVFSTALRVPFRVTHITWHCGGMNRHLSVGIRLEFKFQLHSSASVWSVRFRNPSKPQFPLLIATWWAYCEHLRSWHR